MFGAPTVAYRGRLLMLSMAIRPLLQRHRGTTTNKGGSSEFSTTRSVHAMHKEKDKYLCTSLERTPSHMKTVQDALPPPTLQSVQCGPELLYTPIASHPPPLLHASPTHGFAKYRPAQPRTQWNPSPCCWGHVLLAQHQLHRRPRLQRLLQQQQPQSCPWRPLRQLPQPWPAPSDAQPPSPCCPARTTGESDAR